MTKQAVVVRNGESEALSVTGAEVRLLCAGELTGQAWSVSECTAPENSGPPPHQHAWDEGYYILEGEIRFTLGDKQVVAKRGDFVYVPANTLHGFQGASATPARMLYFDAPAHAGSFFRDAAREIKDFPRDAYKMAEIGERHGIHFIR
jgi:quercetin dioxygenase-like cupin family protein